MICLALIATLAVAPFAAAQSSVAVEAIQAHFQQSAIVPDLLASFDPSALMTLDFAGVGTAQPGQLFNSKQVAPTPTVTITPANASVSLSGSFTLAMVDADVVGSKLPDGQTRHWLANGVTLDGSTVSNATATVITQYAGPGPAAGSGPHRYIVLLYSQPSTFQAPAAFSKPNMGVSVFDFNAYVKDSGLGPLIAGTYITVEEGTATASISATSAVVTSTLPIPSSSASGTKGVSSTGVSSTNATASGPAATETNKSAASALSVGLTGFTATAGLFVLAMFL